MRAFMLLAALSSSPFVACNSSTESSAGTGGQTGKGGSGTGGTTSSGGNTGGTATSSGGTSTSGGSTGQGGKTGTGGVSGTGGKSESGGTKSTGGAGETGGATGIDAAIGTGGGGGRDGGVIRDGGPADRSATGGGSGAGGTPTGGSTGSGIDGGSTSGKSAGCGKTSTITQFNNGTPISITVGGKQRRYILNVPKNYDNTKPYKLVLTIHQLDGNDKQMFNWQYYGLLPLSNDTAIFAAPNGQKGGSPCSGTGDGDSGCGWPNSSGQDMALVDAVEAQVAENFCVDTNHIFATGWSYGASMSYEIGCERPLGGPGTGDGSWGVRAIAIYSVAQMSGSCKPSTPIGFYLSHGTHDSVLGYSGGITLAQNYGKTNGCTWATPTQVSSGAHVCTNEAGCKTGYPVEVCSFNGDHTPFPDNGQSSGSWGPQEAWKFLSQF
jgi:poly(3-hydroxybutyrate) depolymerase